MTRTRIGRRSYCFFTIEDIEERRKVKTIEIKKSFLTILEKKYQKRL